jgi:hypothetical protein
LRGKTHFVLDILDTFLLLLELLGGRFIRFFQHPIKTIK